MIPHRLASTCLAILGMATLVGCGSASRPTEGSVVPPPPASVSRQTLDEAVIEAALVDLATGSDEDSETLRREQGKGGVTWSGKARDWVGTLTQELAGGSDEAKPVSRLAVRAGSDQWKSLGSADRKAAAEAAANVISRVEGKQFVTAFRPTDQHIALWEDNPASTRPATQPLRRLSDPRPISAAPPGYGDQRGLAVVSFGFAWSMRGGEATYVLRFDGKKWNVISRCFRYYV